MGEEIGPTRVSNEIPEANVSTFILGYSANFLFHVMELVGAFQGQLWHPSQVQVSRKLTLTLLLAKS